MKPSQSKLKPKKLSIERLAISKTIFSFRSPMKWSMLSQWFSENVLLLVKHVAESWRCFCHEEMSFTVEFIFADVMLAPFRK